MRYSLPIFWCVSDETRGKLASLIKERSALRTDECVDWETGKPLKKPHTDQDITDAETHYISCNSK